MLAFGRISDGNYISLVHSVAVVKIIVTWTENCHMESLFLRDCVTDSHVKALADHLVQSGFFSLVLNVARAH